MSKENVCLLTDCVYEFTRTESVWPVVNAPRDSFFFFVLKRRCAVTRLLVINNRKERKVVLTSGDRACDRLVTRFGGLVFAYA